jgi:hypothetical protein
MNQTDSCLERMFRAAASVQRELPPEAPFALERRVLAAWRQAQSEDPSALLIPLFRRAFICACAILAISMALTLQSLNDSPNELVIVDSLIQSSVLQ